MRLDQGENLRILVRGGGDLASGAVLRMRRAGWHVLVVELAEPRAVRRAVSFAQAVYSGEVYVEDIAARLVSSEAEIETALASGVVPVMVDPLAEIREIFAPHVLVDGRMRKMRPELGKDAAPLVVGLGPGFSAGEDCHAVVETNRGPFLGRVYWHGTAQEDTGIPEGVGGAREERVLRSPGSGVFRPAAGIGQFVTRGQTVAWVENAAIIAPFDGILRGLLQGGLIVQEHEKVGDLDPRGDPRLCSLVSDKALAVGGGVVEAVLTWRAMKGSE